MYLLLVVRLVVIAGSVFVIYPVVIRTFRSSCNREGLPPWRLFSVGEREIDP